MTAGGSTAACLLRLFDEFGAMQGVLGKLLVGTYSGAVVVGLIPYFLFIAFPSYKAFDSHETQTNCLEVVLVIYVVPGHT